MNQSRVLVVAVLGHAIILLADGALFRDEIRFTFHQHVFVVIIPVKEDPGLVKQARGMNFTPCSIVFGLRPLHSGVLVSLGLPRIVLAFQ